MSKIRGLGIHTYLGGFTVGVSRNSCVDVLGSVETWEPARKWAPRLGINILDYGVPLKADYVFANPPCARFSAMTFSKFSASSRENVEEFAEVLEVLETARNADAQLVHVESGPMWFSHGDQLLAQFNDILGWSEIYFLLFKIDATHAGLPQFRPRTHAFVAKRPFPDLDLTPVPLPENVGEFIKGWNAEYNYEPVPVSDEPDPVLYSAMQRDTAVFLSTRPKIVSRNDLATPSVVSSRPFAWLEENRWFSVDEMAALQGYPPNAFDYAEPGRSLATALISKSVSPSITEYLTERVVVPFFENPNSAPHPMLKVNLT